MAGGPTRPVAVVSFAQSDMMRREEHRNDVEVLQPVIQDVFAKIGLTKDDMGFVCSGSCDYLVGAPFSFVGALDAVGAWPPMRESHVEMDGAFALYEAWTQLQEDDIDTALVFSFGRSSMSEIWRVLTLQLDPYYMAPLWPDPVALAALQAQALIDAGKYSEADFAAVAARRDAMRATIPTPRSQATTRPRSSSGTTTWSPPCGATPSRPSPTVPPPSSSPPETAPPHCASTRRGSQAWITGSRHTPSGARPRHLAVHPFGRGGGRAR